MRQKFIAEIKKHEGIDGAYVEIPFDVETVFGGKRVKVKAYFNGSEYRGSIVRMAGCYIIGLTQAIRKEIRKIPGDIVTVEVEKDEEERVIEIPEDFAREMKENPSTLEYFEKLSFTNKKKYVQWILSSKKAKTRKERIQKAISMIIESERMRDK